MTAPIGKDPRAHTRDVGGSASTRRCADAIIEAP